MKQLVVPLQTLGSDGRIRLTGDSFHYLARVRRVRPGDEIKVLAGSSPAQAVVVEIGSGHIILQVRTASPEEAKPELCPLTLYPALLKGSKLDDVIRQSVEIGASALGPVETDHCISRLTPPDQDKKMTRWASVVQEAVQQSGSAVLPDLTFCRGVEGLLEHWNARGILLFFHQEPLAKESLHGYLSGASGPVGLAVGPEGGFSSREVELFLAAGAKPAYLGSRVLRAETASLAALSAVRIILEETSAWKTP